MYHTSAVSPHCGQSDVCPVSTRVQTAAHTHDRRKAGCRRDASDGPPAGCNSGIADRRPCTGTVSPGHRACAEASQALHMIRVKYRTNEYIHLVIKRNQNSTS